jgi:hypothetical protein
LSKFFKLTRGKASGYVKEKNVNRKEGLMKKVLCCAAMAIVLTLSANSHATTLEAKIMYWMPDFSADVRVDEEDITGTTVDIDDDLGIDTDEGVVPVEVVLHLGSLFRVWFGYTTISMDGNAVVDKDITFAGETFNINAEIDSHVELTGVEAGLEWDFFASKQFGLDFGFGPCVSGTYFDGSAEISESIFGISAEGTLSTVVPAVGAFGRISFLEDKFKVEGRLMGFTFDDNTYIDGVAEVKYNFLKNFGVIAGYRYRSVEVEEDDIFVDASLSGFYVGGLVSF